MDQLPLNSSIGSLCSGKISKYGNMNLSKVVYFSILESYIIKLSMILFCGVLQSNRTWIEFSH